MSKFLKIDYTPKGDFMSVGLGNGKSTRRKVVWKEHKSPEPKVCEFSGETIRKGDKLGTVPMKTKGMKTIYFHPDFQEKIKSPVEDVDIIKDLDTMLTFLDIYVEEKQEKIIKKERSLRKEVSAIGNKKALVGQMRSKLHTLITAVKTLEEI